MLYMQSTSAPDGTYTLTVTFEIGTDPNIDQVLVQNRVQLALASLPEPVQAQGVSVQKKNTAILQFVTLHSPDDKYDALFLSNYATINVVDALARLPGVGSVKVIGAGEYSMRIWMDPGKLQCFGLDPSDVILRHPPAEPEHRRRPDRHAARAQGRRVPIYDRRQVAPGPARGIRQHRHQGPDRPGRPPDPSERRRADRAGLADLFAGFPRRRQAGRRHRHLPDARFQLAAGRQVEVKALMDQMSKRFPEGLRYAVPYDTTIFVQDSISEVYRTLYEAGILVLIVILVFLQNFRATLVPATTVPVTIIGAFAGMAALGYTVNLSTLFGIVLAIGIVVDDAIVIVEGVTKYIEQGLSGHDAAIKAMDELFGPIIGITLVLMSVFLPAAFVPGLTGNMFAQFALVIAVTALSARSTPRPSSRRNARSGCAPAVPPEKRNVFFRAFNNDLRPDGARLHRFHRQHGPSQRADGDPRPDRLRRSASGAWRASRPPSSRSTTRAI